MSSPTTVIEQSENQKTSDISGEVSCELEPEDENLYGLNLEGVKVENSRDVYFGDKNEFNGPLNVEDFKKRESDKSANDLDASKKKTDGLTKKGYIWLQNAPKYNSALLGISLGLVLLFIVLLVTLLCLKEDIKTEDKLRFVTREEWEGNPPTNETTPLVTPVPYVIIHHTATENCSTFEECAMHARAIQAFHMNSREWYDIGYNFLIGGDGFIYVGRGWTKEGAHTFGWNSQSLGIAFIGTFMENLPPEHSLQACKDLIKLGIDLNYIKEDYKILGAKQFYGTESPGTAIMNEIKTWEHWVKNP